MPLQKLSDAFHGRAPRSTDSARAGGSGSGGNELLLLPGEAGARSLYSQPVQARPVGLADARRQTATTAAGDDAGKPVKVYRWNEFGKEETTEFDASHFELEGHFESNSSAGHKEYQDRIRAIHFRQEGKQKAEIAKVLGRSEKFVAKWWMKDQKEIPRPWGVHEYLTKDLGQKTFNNGAGDAMDGAKSNASWWRDVEVKRRYGEDPAIYEELMSNTEWKSGASRTRDFSTGASHLKYDKDGKMRLQGNQSARYERGSSPAFDKMLQKFFAEYGLLDRTSGILLNWYPDGGSALGTHRHDCWTALFSFGQERILTIDRTPLLCQDGDLVIFGTQRHGVPRMPEVNEGRITVPIFFYPDSMQMQKQWQTVTDPENVTASRQLRGLERDFSLAQPGAELALWQEPGRAAALEQLRAMGFPTEAAMAAMRACGFDVDQAANTLLMAGAGFSDSMIPPCCMELLGDGAAEVASGGVDAGVAAEVVGGGVGAGAAAGLADGGAAGGAAAVAEAGGGPPKRGGRWAARAAAAKDLASCSTAASSTGVFCPAGEGGGGEGEVVGGTVEPSGGGGCGGGSSSSSIPPAISDVAAGEPPSCEDDAALALRLQFGDEAEAWQPPATGSSSSSSWAHGGHGGGRDADADTAAAAALAVQLEEEDLAQGFNPELLQAQFQEYDDGMSREQAEDWHGHGDLMNSGLARSTLSLQSMDKVTCYSIGHGHLREKDFYELLSLNSVRTLYDFRRSDHRGDVHAPSAHFNVKALKSTCRARGITYKHIALGRESAYGILCHVTSDEAQHALVELAWHAKRGRTAFLGFEEDWQSDHRQVIAEELVKAGHVVKHITSSGATEDHVTGRALPDFIVREEEKLRKIEKMRQAGELKRPEKSSVDRSSQAVATQLELGPREVDAMAELAAAGNQVELVQAQRRLARVQRIADKHGALSHKKLSNVPQWILEEAREQEVWIAQKKAEKLQASKSAAAPPAADGDGDAKSSGPEGAAAAASGEGGDGDAAAARSADDALVVDCLGCGEGMPWDDLAAGDGHCAVCAVAATVGSDSLEAPAARGQKPVQQPVQQPAQQRASGWRNRRRGVALEGGSAAVGSDAAGAGVAAVGGVPVAVG